MMDIRIVIVHMCGSIIEYAPGVGVQNFEPLRLYHFVNVGVENFQPLQGSVPVFNDIHFTRSERYFKFKKEILYIKMFLV
jgi:hypothetical protein